MREQTQLRIIREVLDSYQGKEPFHRFLKKYYNLNRQLGSRDRRLITDFSYNYFRIGNLFQDKPWSERIALANKLCKADETPLLQYAFREVDNFEKIPSRIEPDKLFPFGRHLSDSINKAEFIHSFLVQPRVWIRVRQEFMQAVEDELNAREITFEKNTHPSNAWSFKPSSSLDQLESFQKGYFEIQDLSSQKTIEFIEPRKGETWWDACAGSGGKSLMIAAQEPGVKLVCTDSRNSVLKNLSERFRKTGFTNYKVALMDLTSNAIQKSVLSSLDGIVADVPCSGSGTWSRTPEWLTYFNVKSILKYQATQREIISNIVRFLPENKPLIYITCSVFKAENEENTAWMSEHLPLKIQTQAYIEGAAYGADTLFATRFKKI